MHSRLLIPDSVIVIANRHEHLVTRRDLLDCGLPAPVVARIAREVVAILPGVYWLRPANLTLSQPPFLTRASAGVLYGGEQAMVGYDAAAHLHGLIADEPDLIVVVTPLTRQIRLQEPGWSFRRGGFDQRRASRPVWPPRTTIEDTVLDLAAERSEKALIGLVADACQRELTTPDRLRRRMGERPRQAQRRMLSTILDDVAGGSTSRLEWEYLTHVERRHGLPPSVRQHRVRGTSHLCDCGYPQFGLVIELDGFAFHHGSRAFRDAERDNAYVLQGLAALRFGWPDVLGDPCLVARQVAEMLIRLGWTGTFTPCATCPPLW